jgi:hypothetical protein
MKKMATTNWVVFIVILVSIFAHVNGMENEKEKSAKISQDSISFLNQNVWKIIFEFMGVMETFARLIVVNKKIHRTINRTLIYINSRQIFRRVPDTIKLYLVHAYANHLSILDDVHLLPFWTQLDILTNLALLQRPLELDPDRSYIIPISNYFSSKFAYYDVQDQRLFISRTMETGISPGIELSHVFSFSISDPSV